MVEVKGFKTETEYHVPDEDGQIYLRWRGEAQQGSKYFHAQIDEQDTNFYVYVYYGNHPDIPPTPLPHSTYTIVELYDQTSSTVAEAIQLIEDHVVQVLSRVK